jgi:hypothetical protein
LEYCVCGGNVGCEKRTDWVMESKKNVEIGRLFTLVRGYFLGKIL